MQVDLAAVGAPSLSLDDTQVSDTGVSCLSSLRKMRDLSLCRTKITDASLEHIGQLKNLSALRLGGTHITGDGFRYIHSLPLNTVELSQTDVDDSRTLQLAKIPTLERLVLFGTNVSPSTIAELLAHTRSPFRSLVVDY